jgi:LacI family transcriptional regulator
VSDQRRIPVTIKDIARSLDLAHSTVSRALNDHPSIGDVTKLRVRSEAKRLGYFPDSSARIMRGSTSLLVGLIVPDIENEFYNAAAKAMTRVCSLRGYQLVLSVSDDDPIQEQRHVEALRGSKAAGIVIVPTAKPRARTAQLLRDVPTVQFLRYARAIGKIVVRADEGQGIFEAVQHLLGLGHKRIGYIGGPRGLSTGDSRVAGYERALKEGKLKEDVSLACLGLPRPEFGYAALATLLDLANPPTALVVAGSRQLLGSLTAIAERKIDVPAQLSVVGYGDPAWFQICRPSITAVALPVLEMATRAGNLLFELMDRSAEAVGRPAEPAFMPQLIVRETSASPSFVRPRHSR